MGGNKERLGRHRAHFGVMDDAVHKARRKERIKRSQREFEEEQQGLEDQELGMQFLEKRLEIQLNRALGALEHVYNGTETPEDICYLLSYGDELGPTTIVGKKTIVDFTSPTKKELPDAA